MSDITVKAAIEARLKLNSDIANLFNEFTASTGLRIVSLDVSLDWETVPNRGSSPRTYTVTAGVSL
jgi:hypothetical protein